MILNAGIIKIFRCPLIGHTLEKIVIRWSRQKMSNNKNGELRRWLELLIMMK